MLIGINAIAAFRSPRTGVEEYTCQVIKHLAMLEEVKKYRFVLYTSEQRTANSEQYFLDFDLPRNFKIRQLNWPLPMWTQIRLATEMFFNQPDVLFIPVHILPLIHPKNSVVTIHGLEYEYYPEMYPWQHLQYLRWSTKYALKHAQKIIAVSENTKKDLVELYGGKAEKIKVVYHGVEQGQCFGTSQGQSCFVRTVPVLSQGLFLKSSYILFTGRLEKKKNIDGLIRAFHLLKEEYKVPHKLVLVGPPGYGYRNPKYQILNTKYENDIILTGYVSEQEKWSLLKNADVFVLPSFYEGFGLPILEAQVAGSPVVTSNVSSMPEIAGEGAILVNPKDIEEIVEGIYKIIKDDSLKKDLIQKGYANAKRFSWQKCAQETLKILLESRRESKYSSLVTKKRCREQEI
jgi:glycosyltransferase involved in cell wall biosynthesis